uniref:Putative secreted protein n=1 Tax=Anopheles darlingi TaxID=43151 RepID=A0A2M4D5T2_ANODA
MRLALSVVRLLQMAGCSECFSSGAEFRMPLYDAVNTRQIMRSTIRVYGDDDDGSAHHYHLLGRGLCYHGTANVLSYVCYFYACTMAGEWRSGDNSLEISRTVAANWFRFCDCRRRSELV